MPWSGAQRLPWVVAAASGIGSILGLGLVLLAAPAPGERDPGPRVLELPVEQPASVGWDEPWAERLPALPVAGGPPLVLDAALFEPSAWGFLPLATADGRLPRTALGRRPSPIDGPRIAVLLVEVGLDEAAFVRVLSLTRPVTLVVSPYADPRRGWYRAARWMGFETALELPIRRTSSPLEDAGPLALRPPLSDASQLAAVLARGLGYVAVALGPMAAANEPAAFAPIVSELARRGLGLVELGTSDLAPLARAEGVPYLRVDGPVDADPAPEAIDAALRGLEKRATSKGFAAGFGRPLAVTLDRLTRWGQELPGRGITLVGVSALFDDVSPPAEAR